VFCTLLNLMTNGLDEEGEEEEKVKKDRERGNVYWK
jgi:hypothetical protein